MTSRQESHIGFLILACALTFLFLTNVSSSDAQISSRRSSEVGSEVRPQIVPDVSFEVAELTTEPIAIEPLPFEEAPPEPALEARPTGPAASPINQPVVPRVARSSSPQSPMARQIRSQLTQQRKFQTSAAIGPTRSRTIYNIRKQLEQEDSQTVEELLEEMDRAPAQTDPSQPIEPALDPSPGDEDSFPPDAANRGQNQGRNQTQSPDYEFALDPSVSPSANPTVLPTYLPGDPNVLRNDLSFFELLAIQNHPTLNASAARILTARHEALQAGLRPNPRLGLFIDEAGNENEAGLWGAFLQRNHIRGNKLELGQEIKHREASVLEVEFETQAIRINTDVRTAFYKLLIAKEKLNLVGELYQNQRKAVDKSNQLFESGETPRTDLLQTELQLQRTEVLLSQLEIAVHNAWHALTSVVGEPELEPREIIGDLSPTAVPVSFEQCRAHILNHSPEILSAQAELSRIQATIQREIAQTIPDYQTQLTLGRDAITDNFFTGLQVQFPLQTSNQNQGNIAAAQSRLVEAQNDLQRIKLDLSKRLAVEHRQYESALAKTSSYLNRLLPKSKQTLKLLEQGYPEEVSFLQLSTAQKTVIDITLEYLDTLSLLWSSRLKIEGLLLDDSLAR